MVEIILGNKFDPLFIIIITNEEIIDLFIHFSTVKPFYNTDTFSYADLLRENF
jgi:hypothetical protein